MCKLTLIGPVPEQTGETFQNVTTLPDQKALVPYSIDGSDSPVFSKNINHFPNHSIKTQ